MGEGKYEDEDNSIKTRIPPWYAVQSVTEQQREKRVLKNLSNKESDDLHSITMFWQKRK